MSDNDKTWNGTGSQQVDGKDNEARGSLAWQRDSESSFSNDNAPYESSQDRERSVNQREFKLREDEKLLEQERKSADLARAIEAEIIPRLLLSQLATRTAKAVAELPPIVKSDVFSGTQLAEFSQLVLHKSVPIAVTYIDVLLENGMSTETMILDVLSPTARHLGDLWTEDKITFIDVTLGLSRLQQLLRIYGPTFELEFALDQKGHKILLSTMPGEQHTFGMSVVEEFFRRDGWDVQSTSDETASQLLSRVRQEWFDVVGLSASGDASVKLLTPLIQAIRKASRNREIRVIVGGCPFLAEPANALKLGADLVACNGREAVLSVERLLNPDLLQ